MSSGGTPSRAEPQYWGGNIPWLNTSAINFNTVSQPSEMITEAGLRNSAAKVFSKGSLLMAMYGQGATRGRVAYLGFDAAVNQACAVIQPTSKVTAKFLYFSLEHSYGEIRQLGHGGNQKNLNAALIRSIRLYVPPLSKQHAIVEILDDADTAICTIDKLIGTKLRYKAAVAEQVLTRKKWPEVLLGNLFRERIEADLPTLKLLAVTNSAGVVDRDTLTKRDTSSDDKAKYRHVCVGDIAYNTMRMWQGVFGLSEMEGIVSPAYTVCVPSPETHGPFMVHLFKLPQTISLFHRHSQGLVKDTLNLKFSHFAKIRVRVPSFSEQIQIADCLDLMEREIALLRRQCHALSEQKRGLMHLLLTGEKRAKGFGP